MKKTKPKYELENRSFLFEVRAEEDEKGNVITGRPIVYNTPTDMIYYDEIIDRGALEKTDLTDVRFLVNHDISKIPLARSRRNNGNSTMTLDIDANGMTIRVILDTENNSEAKALYSAVKRGDISGMSFMFAVRERKWEKLDSDHPICHITDISKVVEVSAVTFPAYDQTEISARSHGALENARKALENAKRDEKSPEGDNINYLKAKINFLGGI